MDRDVLKRVMDNSPEPIRAGLMHCLNNDVKLRPFLEDALDRAYDEVVDGNIERENVFAIIEIGYR